MNGHRTGLEQDVETRIMDLFAQIDVLAIEKEPFIPTAHLVQHRSFDEHARTGNPIDFCSPSVGMGVANHLVAPFPPRKDALKEDRLGICRAEAGESSEGEVDGAVVPANQRGDNPGSIVSGKKVDELFDLGRLDAPVGIEEENVRSPTGSPAVVTAVCEATVLVQADGLNRKISHR